MKKKKITMAQLARELYLSRSYVFFLVTLQKRPSKELMEALAGMFDLDVDVLSASYGVVPVEFLEAVKKAPKEACEAMRDFTVYVHLEKGNSGENSY